MPILAFWAAWLQLTMPPTFAAAWFHFLHPDLRRSR